MKDLVTMRHSAAHLLAAGVKKLFPGTKLGIGPVIEDGFYYDLDSTHRFSESDLGEIEKEIVNLKKQRLPFKKSVKQIDEAEKYSRELSEPFKTELIADLKKAGETEVSFYQTGDFVDLCTGPHVEDSGQVGEVKLLSVAGAYWKGSEKNKMLQRIYGTAWTSKAELEDYLKRREEAKDKDHRKLGKDLDLFVFSDLIGKGLPLLTPKGAALKRALERFIVDEELKRGYLHVSTPPLARTDLYRLSGHYPYYKDSMYPVMKIDDEELILRPMTCPHHFILFKSRPRSYKELPLRLAEISPQFRYEKSGELSGLSRVRTFTLADAHIFSTQEQVSDVLKEVLDLINFVNKAIGFEKGKDFTYRLSLGSREDERKFYKDDKAWEAAEKTLRQVLEERHEPFKEAEGEAAFYGPKIDVQMKNVLGKEETVFTVQYDFVMPKRFNLSYIDKDGKEKEPIVIHRSSVGALERVMAFIIEKTGGSLPTWLSPIQVQVIPIADRHLDYARRVVSLLTDLNIRVHLDERSESMQSKVRDSQLQKIPFMLIVGDKEQAQDKVAIRSREKGDLGAAPLKQFLKEFEIEVNKSHE
jgi:threonyl-tRNA synthetase